MPEFHDATPTPSDALPPLPDERLGAILDALRAPLTGDQFPPMPPSRCQRARDDVARAWTEILIDERNPPGVSAAIDLAATSLCAGLADLNDSFIQEAHTLLGQAAVGLAAGMAEKVFALGLQRLATALNEADDLAPRRVLRSACSTAIETSMRTRRLDASAALVTFGRNDSRPLPLLHRHWPDARQRLDREAGVIRLSFPKSGQREPFETVLRFPPCPLSAPGRQALAQDAAIARLDRFLDGRVRRDDSKMSDWAAPEISLVGDEIRIGRLPVATLTPNGERFSRNARSHALEVLEPARWRTPPVQGWSRPAFPLRRMKRPGPHDRQLRLVVQLEEDAITTRDAAAQKVRYPGQTILVQADRSGGHRILGGAPRPRHWLPDLTIKVELHGHAGRLGNSDELALSGYSAQALAERLAQVLDHLNCPTPVDAVNLTTCALASPVFPRDFAAEFLADAHRRQLLQPHATVTAYEDPISFDVDEHTGEKLRSRWTHFGKQPGEAHLPGKTWIYTRDPGSGDIRRRDKYGAASSGNDLDPDVAAPCWMPLPPLFPR